MRQFNVLFRWGWTFLVAIFLTFGLVGCEGDDGAQGPQGPQGPQGTGTQGDQGPPGTAASVTPLESCGVCHSEDSFASAPAAHAKVTEPGVVDVGSFANFSVAQDPDVLTDLIVSFSVTGDGEPATDAVFADYGNVYVSTGLVRRSSSSREAEPLDVEWSRDGVGGYSVRIVDGFTLFGDTNSRYLAIVEVGDNALEIPAVGDYPDEIPLAGLASSEACVGCHGESGEVGRFAPTNRGGHYSAPISANQCVVCHRPGDPDDPDNNEPTYMRLVRVVHGIHNSHNFPDGEFVTDRDNTYNITYPTYMTNCSVCHSDETILPGPEVSALAAANAMPVSPDPEGCFSCHGSLESWDFLIRQPDGSNIDYSSLHANLDLELETACSVCHQPGGAAGTKLVVTDFHNYRLGVDGEPDGIVTERGGQIVDGADTSLTEGAKFVWEITGVEVVDDGANLAISWQASYGGNPVEPCNATVGEGAPVFHLGENAEELSMYRSYAQGDDFIIGTSTSAPGQPGSVDLTEANTNCDDNAFVAVTTLPVDDVDAEKGRLALGGKPLVVGVGIPTESMEARVPTPTYDYLVDDGALAGRRNVVDTEQCLGCHVGSLYQHGGDRVDNVDMCLICHNAASNEKNRRVAMGVDASEAYDGKSGETFEMKTMLHRIHSAATEDSPPYVIYRSRGIYAFAPDVSDVPNWAVGDACVDRFGRDGNIVFGADPELDTDVTCQEHNFHSADYPRALNACTACHTDPFTVIPDQTLSMANTTEAGSEEWANQLDDTLQGAATTACITCHKDGAAKGHAYQNSWTPQVFPEGRQTIIDAVN